MAARGACSSVGRASERGPEGRRFEPGHAPYDILEKCLSLLRINASQVRRKELLVGLLP